MILGPEHLQAVAWITAGVLLALAFLTAFMSDGFLKALQAFPRHRTLSIVLTAIALVWSALMVDQMSLGELTRFKWLLYVLVPLSFYFIIQYLDDLLAVRALAGLMMLAPALMLDASRWHTSPWRYTIAILSYIMIVKGMWLMLCPFKFRIWTNAIFASSGRRKAAAAALAVTGFLFVITALNA